MTTLCVEGFDEYGPYVGLLPLDAQGDIQARLLAGGWTYGTSYTSTLIVPGLSSAPGYAVCVGAPNFSYASLNKVLNANYGRLIGGTRFSSSLQNVVGVVFLDGTTPQFSIVVLESGAIAVAEAAFGTVLETSSVTVGPLEPHYLEWDITFNSTSVGDLGISWLGGWTIWLDGNLILGLTGVTQQSGNASANTVGLANFTTPEQPSVGYAFFDDFYLFDDTTNYNNGPLLSSPVVLTQTPAQNAQNSFTNLGNVVGNYYEYVATEATTYQVAANSIYLMAFVPEANCTLTEVVANLSSYYASNSSAHFCGVLYSDLNGVPNSLLSGGTQVTGFVAGGTVTMPLTAAQNLTAGTQYWMGFINDSAMSFYEANLGIKFGAIASNTYGSGAPSAAPTMAVTNSFYMYGVCSGALNWASLTTNPPFGDGSAVASGLAGSVELYNFAALPANVEVVYTVDVRASFKAVSGAATRMVGLLAESGSTLSEGSAGAITATTSYEWYDSLFDLDPNSSAAWTPTGASLAIYGMTILA